MASTGVKEYTLRINGVNTSLKEITSLEAAVKKLDSAVKNANAGAAVSAKASTTRKAALTDEEKALQRLENAQKRLERVNSDVNKAQIETNIAIREQTRELTRSIQISQLAEGSIKQMGMTLTDLRNEYESLSAAERAEEEIGGRLLTQIQALDAEYKSLRESTGNFRDSVGNYGRALDGLQKLSGGLKSASDASLGLATDLVGTNKMMMLFGTSAKDVSEGLSTFHKIVMLAVAAQQLYTAATSQGVIADGLAATVSATRAFQLKAQTAAQALATKGTVAATVAQKALNLVASANPYVLLALALTSVAGALFAFSNRTEDAAKKQEEINRLQSEYLDLLDREAGKLKTVGEDRIRIAERALQLLQAQGAETAKIRAAEDKLAAERRLNNARQRGFYGQELKDLDANKKKLEDLTETLRLLNLERERGANKTYLDIEGRLDMKSVTPRKIEDAIAAVQGQIDNVGRSVKVAVELNTEQAEIEHEAQIAAAKRTQEAIELAKTRRDIEIAAAREAEDARNSIIENGFEREYRAIVANADRRIEDIKRRLAEEKNLTEKARKDLNDTIYAIDVERFRLLDSLREEQAAKELETIRAAEDSQTSLITGEMDRRLAEINLQYDRQIADLKKRLDTEKDLTEKEQKAISQIIVNSETARQREIEELTVKNLERAANLRIRSIDATLKTVREKTGELTARETEGMQLIDVEKTQENFEKVQSALATYVSDLKAYQDELTGVFEASTEAMDENSIEYQEALLNYSIAMDDVTARIAAALKEQEDLAKKSSRVQLDYYADLFGKIAQLANAATDAIYAVMDTFSMGLQFSIDNLNDELDAINDRFEKVQEEREKAVENVEILEERMRNATGGTAEALKSQLQDAMHARQEAEREEARLAKEKEKREAEIQKREKQQRRNDLIAGIAQGTANTAEGVTKMLSLPWPLNLVMAAVVGATGTAQVGIMTQQLTKLEDGGKIEGKPHSQGGARIEGTNIEVEGNEWVVNKYSSMANDGLIEFINEKRGPVSLADLFDFYGGDLAAPDYGGPDSDRIVEAIESIELKPVVSVVDITEAQENITAVEELSDFR